MNTRTTKRVDAILARLRRDPNDVEAHLEATIISREFWRDKDISPSCERRNNADTQLEAIERSSVIGLGLIRMNIRYRNMRLQGKRGRGKTKVKTESQEGGGGDGGQSSSLSKVPDQEEKV